MYWVPYKTSQDLQSNYKTKAKAENIVRDTIGIEWQLVTKEYEVMKLQLAECPRDC